MVTHSFDKKIQLNTIFSDINFLKSFYIWLHIAWSVFLSPSDAGLAEMIAASSRLLFRRTQARWGGAEWIRRSGREQVSLSAELQSQIRPFRLNCLLALRFPPLWHSGIVQIYGSAITDRVVNGGVVVGEWAGGGGGFGGTVWFVEDLAEGVRRQVRRRIHTTILIYISGHLLLFINVEYVFWG